MTGSGPPLRSILTYHSIDGSGSPISVAPGEFAAHVAFLASGRVRVLPLARLLADAGSAPAVAITFDDGFANFAAEAWPRLRDAGLPATVYVVTERVGRTNRWLPGGERGIPELPLMDWEAVARAAEEGAEIGSHTRTHARLPGLPDARLEDEVEAASATIAARTGLRPASFAYPYGDHDGRVVEAVRRSHATAVTTELSALRGGDDPLRLPRLDAYYLRRPGRLEGYGGPAFARYVGRRAFLRGVRARAGSLLGTGSSRGYDPAVPHGEDG